ncbi:hypothetical protein ES703_63593 [subsurface metagenome]
MPPCLLLNTIGSGDHQNGNLGMASAGEHILDKFFMTRDINDGIVILAFEENSSRIYGALFFQFFLKRIKEIGEFEFFLVLLNEFLDFGYLILRKYL